MILQNRHISVLLNECIENLNLGEGKIIVDATMGGGGHSLEIVKRIFPTGRLIGVDKDIEAIERCKKRLCEYEQSVTYIKSDFKNVKEKILEMYPGGVDGILADLGVSSFQLEDKKRGFSYNEDTRLDMRMDLSSDFTAYDVVNGYSKDELKRIFYEYGEEKWSARIAEFIVNERKNSLIETTGKLCEVIKKAIPAAARRGGPHPAKRVFQAIRIEVNGELEGLKEVTKDFVSMLKPGGRLCIITFHSLEDRAVKQAMKSLYNPCTCPPGSPICTCGKTRQIEIITRKPILPSEKELLENPRARSAKLRVAEKL